jgi:hypothetical protein
MEEGVLFGEVNSMCRWRGSGTVGKLIYWSDIRDFRRQEGVKKKHLFGLTYCAQVFFLSHWFGCEQLQTGRET